MLVLRVNRDTGELSIRNPLGAPVTQFDGYTITSPVGSLLSTYKGISAPPAGNAGWEKAPANSTLGLAEFKPTGVFDVSSAATNVTLGTGFSKTAVASQPLGTSGEDLTFRYHARGRRAVTGQIEYIGTPYLNNISLIVNTTNGQATLKNDTLVSRSIDGYSILSATGALNGATWNSLADRPGTFPNWLESPDDGQRPLGDESRGAAHADRRPVDQPWQHRQFLDAGRSRRVEHEVHLRQREHVPTGDDLLYDRTSRAISTATAG